MTKKYGNVSNNPKANQRSRNTGPSRGLDLMDESAARGPGTEVASGSASVAAGNGGTSSLYDRAQQLKKTSGINIIWICSKGANARDLHLNVDKKDLISDMKLLTRQG